MRRKNKVVWRYRCSTVIFYLLDLYMQRLPKEAKETNVFYCSALQKFLKEEGMPWFSTVRIGKNSLDRYVKDMCLVAGIEGKTKQSLRALVTTRMYRQGIPEKAIQSRSGHRY